MKKGKATQKAMKYAKCKMKAEKWVVGYESIQIKTSIP